MGVKFCHPEPEAFCCHWDCLCMESPFLLSAFGLSFIICGCTEKTSERAVPHSYLDMYLRMGCSSLERYLFLFINKKQTHCLVQTPQPAFRWWGSMGRIPFKTWWKRSQGPVGSTAAQNMTSNKQMNDLSWWRTTLLCTAFFQRVNQFFSPRKIICQW